MVFPMKPTVVVVNNDSFSDSIKHIEGMNDLNSPEKRVIVKVGIYNTNTGICTTPKTLQSIIEVFDRSSEILVTESDSGAGPGLERLQIWRECFNDRVLPYNLSEDKRTLGLYLKPFKEYRMLIRYLHI